MAKKNDKNIEEKNFISRIVDYGSDVLNEVDQTITNDILGYILDRAVPKVTYNIKNIATKVPSAFGSTLMSLLTPQTVYAPTRDWKKEFENIDWEKYKSKSNTKKEENYNIIYNPLVDETQKYAYGGTPIKMTTPSQAISQGNIDIVKNQYDIENKYGWMDTLGNTAIQLGGKVLGGQDGALGQLGNVVSNVGQSQNGTEAVMGILNGIDIGGLIGKIGNKDTTPTMAFGGEVPSTPDNLRNVDSYDMGSMTDNVPIEAEGKELIETPDGMVSEIMGASHEDGGVNMEVPKRSKIYSKRVKGLDGKTMAKRKEFREKHLAKLQRLVELHPNDKVLKKTLEKTTKDFQKQDDEDVMYMQHQNDSKSFYDEMSGGNMGFNNPEESGKYAVGGVVNNNPIKGILPHQDRGSRPTKFGKKPFDYSEINMYEDMLMGNQDFIQMSYNLGNKMDVMSFQKKIGMTPNQMDGVYGHNTHNAYLNYLKQQMGRMPVQGKTAGLNMSGIKTGADAITADLTGIERPLLNYSDDTNVLDGSTEDNKNKGNFWDKFGKGIKDVYDNSNMTFGDILGLYGQYRAGTDPLDLTMQQRSGDTPNINPYEDYGLKGIEQMEQVKNNLDNILSQNKQNNLTNTNTARANANSNARGINTLRAMNLAIDHQHNLADNQAYAQYAQQLAGVDQAIANMLDNRDKHVMAGEEQRDLNDRKDRDSFYTQLQKDTNTKNQMYQQIGKTLNNIKERDFGFNAINQMNRFKVDKNGKISAKANGVYEPHEQTALERGMTLQQLENFNKGIADGTIEYNKDKKGYFDSETGKELDNDGNVLKDGRTIETNMVKKANSLQKVYQQAYGNQLNLHRELTGMEWQKVINQYNKDMYTPVKLDDGTEIDISNLDFSIFNGKKFENLVDKNGNPFKSQQQFNNYINAGNTPEEFNIEEHYVPYETGDINNKYFTTHKFATGIDNKNNLIEQEERINARDVNEKQKILAKKFYHDMKDKNIKGVKFDFNNPETIEWLKDQLQNPFINSENAMLYTMGYGKAYENSQKFRKQYNNSKKTTKKGK